jgi:hypothetical protein
MATAYTSLLGLALPVTGELSGTWGDTVNNSITSLLDSAVAGTQTLTADTTLTTTTGASNQARQAILLCSPASANITITAPAQSKSYIVINTSGTYTVKIRGVGPTTGTTLAVSETAVVAWNGSDFVKVSTTANVSSFSAGSTGLTPSTASTGAVSLAGTLVVANGGSGATTLTGVLKGNGTSAFTAATAGTDYVAPGTATTFTALQTFAGTSSNADLKTSNILEVATVSATAATGTINYDVTTQSVLYYTTNASGNFTVNFRGSSGTSLNTVMSTGESLSATFLVTNGSTAYYNSAVQVDGSSVTPKWQGGSAPTSGNASSIDSYTYVIIKTGSAAFTVLASVTKFA